jgi:hypothetical protein
VSDHAKAVLPVDSRLQQPRRRFSPKLFEKHPAIWVALVLWVASNGFVHMVAKVATWEGEAKYFQVADLCQHDCGWYERVLMEGYYRTPTADSGSNWPFHPLFPIMTYPLQHWLRLAPRLSLVLASKLALLFAIYGFLLLVGAETATFAERVFSGSLVAFNPYVIYAHAGYAEPLYFGLLALAFYLLEKQQWINSGIAGALTSASRIIGFVFALSYATAWLRQAKWRPIWRQSDKLLGLMLCPLGTAIYMLYLYHHTGDALAQVHSHIAWGKSPGSPVQAFLQAYSYHHWPRVFAFMAIASLLASVYLFFLNKVELAVYLAVSTLLSLSGGFVSLARYIWWQPPFLCAIYYLLRRHSAWWPVYTTFAAGLAAYMIVSWWMLGHLFIV